MGFWGELSKQYEVTKRQLLGSNFYEERALDLLKRRGFYDSLLHGLYHLFIVGPTGMGKSKLIEALIRYLLAREDRPTIILLDPGGATAQQVENWALANGFGEEMIILDPEEQGYYLAYNPLAPTPNLPISLQAKFLQEAIYTALRIDEKGKDSIFYAPMLRQCLYYLAHLLMETNYSFAEVPYLLSTSPNSTAMAIVERAKTESVKEFWLDLQRLKPSQRQQSLGLLQAELLSFINSPLIQRMMGQREHTLDFSQFIESGGLFIANLEAGSSLTGMDSRLLTNLLISSVVRSSFAREPYQGREVYLILEEAGEIEFSSDIGTILRRARKQGLRTILLNQDLCSMIEDDPKIFSMLWANSNHKVAFGDLPMRDLEILAREFYGEEFDLKELKDEIETVYFEPRETTRTIRSSSSIDSSSDSEMEGWGGSLGEAEIFTEGGLILPLPETIHFTESKGSSWSQGRGSSLSHADIEGEVTVPFYEYLKRSQVTSRQFWPLEEHLHRSMVRLKRLQKGEIALKRRGQRVEFLKVPYIPETPPAKDHQKLRERIFKEKSFYATLEEIEAEREKRRKELDHREVKIE